MFKSYRIGFLNPWRGKAENQAFFSLKIAAERVGHDLFHLTNSDEILEADVDFVLAVHPNQPKTTDIPTFGVIHSPRALLLEHDYYGQNLLTYDGYLTIMDSIERFLRPLCAGSYRPAHIGFYYNSPQRQTYSADLENLISQRMVRLCYFGTNWDMRARPLFEILAKRPYMQIYGPEGAWDYLNGQGYYGPVPFDGEAVQRTYADFGAGLVVLSEQHAHDDVISNRIFEITSVGAVAICPDIPWIRKNFEDTVYYYRPFESAEGIAADIDAAFDKISDEPETAKQKAARSRLIFEERFAAEAMLQNAVTYFDEWKQKGGKPHPPEASPIIDVIVRVGGRPVSTIMRAINSIDNQTAGRFRVIFVRYRPIDLAEITGSGWRRIIEFTILDDPGGGRAQTMTAGLRAVRNELFAMLDDDDFWLSGHIAGLLAQVDQCSRDKAYAFSGIINVHEPAPGECATDCERRHIASMVRPSGNIFDIMGTFAPHSWLASSALLRFIDLDNWTLSTAEDTVLQANLLAGGEPLFSYRATACSVRGSEGSSNFAEAETRAEDVFECFARLYTILDRIEGKFPTPSMSNWSRLNWALQPVQKNPKADSATDTTTDVTTIVLDGDSAARSVDNRNDIVRRPVLFTPERMSLSEHSRLTEQDGRPAAIISMPPMPWAYGALVRIDPAEFFTGSQSIVIQLNSTDSIGVGVLNKTEDQFLVRKQVLPRGAPVELWFPNIEPGDVSAVVIHNWSQPSSSEIFLHAIWLVSEVSQTLISQIAEVASTTMPNNAIATDEHCGLNSVADSRRIAVSRFRADIF
jgi:hypothetical protein